MSLVVKMIALCVIGVGLTSSTPVNANTPFDNNLLGQAPESLSKEIRGCDVPLPGGAFYSIAKVGLKAFGLQGPNDDVTYDQYKCNQQLIEAGEEPVSEEGSSPGLGYLLFNANYAVLDQRPASSVVFALDHYERITNPSPVYAADVSIDPYFPGTGYDLLTPMQSFWGWAVTISMSFMTFIILLVAFAMLFRSRLGGQQVVQIQNAIPSIVLAMILIPLSYPISGLFIDAITLGTNVFHDFMFAPGGPGRDVWESGEEPASIFDQVTGEETESNPDLIREGTRGLYADDPRLGTFGIIQMVSVRSLTEIGRDCYTDGLDSDSTLCKGYGVGGTILKQVESLLNVVGIQEDAASGWLPQLIIQLLFTVIAVVTAFRILKRLMIKFLMLILLPVVSPFIFATVAIPGRGMKAVNWYTKRMAAASLYYIVTYMIFITVIVLSNPAFYNNIPSATTFSYQPPLLAPALSELLTASTAGNSAMAAFFTILTAGLFIYTPKLLDNINGMLGIKDGIPEFVKDVGSEFRSAGNIGFKQAPATALGVGREGLRAGSGLAKGATSLTSGVNRFSRGTSDYLASTTGIETGLSSVAVKKRAVQRQMQAENRLAKAKKAYDGDKSRGNRVELAQAERQLKRTNARNALAGQSVSIPEGEKQEIKYKFFESRTKADINNNTIKLSEAEVTKTTARYFVTLQITSSQHEIPKGAEIKLNSGGSDVGLSINSIVFDSFKDVDGNAAGSRSGTSKLVAKLLETPSISKDTKEVEFKLEISFNKAPTTTFEKALTPGEVYTSPELTVTVGEHTVEKIKLNLLNNNRKRT